MGRKVVSSNMFFKVEEFELNTQKRKKCKFAEAWCSWLLSAKIPQLEGSRKSHSQSLKENSVTMKITSTSPSISLSLFIYLSVFLSIYLSWSGWQSIAIFQHSTVLTVTCTFFNLRH